MALSSEKCVTDFVFRSCDLDAVAVQFEQELCTYGNLERLVNRIASHLCGLGLVKGERALLLGENSLFWVASYLATMRAGLVCVPLPPSIAPSELNAIVNATEPNVALVDSGALTKHSATLDRLRVVTDRASRTNSKTGNIAFDALRRGEGLVGQTFPTIAADDLAALMFTSGSTAVPRGVMVSHGNIIANTNSIIDSLKLTDRDRVMTVLPFHYCFGASLLHTHLRAGGSLVVDSRFMYPEMVLDRMVETECTGFAGVPSHFQILVRSSSLRKRQFPRLRYVQQAGGALAPSLVDELRAALPHTEVFIMYGQTEATARLSSLSPAFTDSRRGSIGKGIPGVSLRVMNDSGDDVRPGEVGEIVAEGENIAKGYWHAPEESRKTFHDAKLYTGDLATVDSEGFIYIVGRDKDFLKCRGERVGCHTLEAQLLENDELIEAAVIGIPDDVLGEAVKAFVVPRVSAREGLAEYVREFCKRRMPPHLVPKEVVIMQALPKSASGKVIKRDLKAP
jgi:long-chain acyl-CoA synthetase